MKYLLLITILIIFSSCQNETDSEGAKSDNNSRLRYLSDSHQKMYVIPYSGIYFRSQPNNNSNIIELLSYNSIVECSATTSKDFKIDNKIGPWFFCNYKNKSGWLYGPYLSYNPNFVINKTIEYISYDNGDADIKFILYKNNKFKIIVKILRDPKDKIINYDGQWTYDNQIIFLQFGSNVNNPKLLFYDGKGNKMPEDNNVDFIDDKSFKINLKDTSIICIWGISCYISKMY